MTIPGLRVAGALFLVGGVIFLIGALSPPWEQWSAPPLRALQVIGQNRRAWYWIHGCFVVGVILTILGFVAFARSLADDPRASLLASLTAAAYATGAIFWLINIMFRTSVQVAAAADVVRTGAIPADYGPWQRWASLLFVLYMALAYLACAGSGWIVLRTGLVARWAGWFAIVFGLTGGAFVGFAVPLMVHIPLIILGVLLLR